MAALLRDRGENASRDWRSRWDVELPPRAGFAIVELRSAAGEEMLQTHLRITNGGVRAERIFAVIPALGEVTGEGTVSPASALDFHLTARVTTAQGLGKAGVGLLTKLNASGSSSKKSEAVKGVPILVTGTANELVITADVQGLLHRDKEAFLSHFKKKQ